MSDTKQPSPAVAPSGAREWTKDEFREKYPEMFKFWNTYDRPLSIDQAWLEFAAMWANYRADSLTAKLQTERLKVWEDNAKLKKELTAERTKREAAEAEVTRLQRARVGDTEIIGRWQCQAEAAERELDIVADRQYIAALTVGWNLGVANNGEGLRDAIESRRAALRGKEGQNG